MICLIHELWINHNVSYPPPTEILRARYCQNPERFFLQSLALAAAHVLV